MRDLGFEELDRVKLIEKYRNHNGVILKGGTIGTVREIKETTVLLQCKHPIEDKEIVLLVSNVLIEPCEKEDLKNIDYKYLVPKIYHKGNIWMIKNETDENDEAYIGLIVDYELKLNENDDIIWIVPIPLDADVNSFRIENELKNKKKYKKQYLEEFASYGI